MHTSTTLKAESFEISLAGEIVSTHDVLPWDVNDRLGVVVTTPYGIVGCSLMVQLATAAFYDARPARREHPQYAEIYAFHVDRPQGDFSHYDLRPRRKEVFLSVEDDLLSAINARAITHLLIPDDVPAGSRSHTYKEPEALLDRIKTCFVYSARGTVADGDTQVTTHDDNLLADTVATLQPHSAVANYRGLLGLPETSDPEEIEDALQSNLIQIEDEDEKAMYLDAAAWIARFEQRIPEVDDTTRGEILEQWQNAAQGGRVTQSYRRISATEALTRLPAAPAQ